MAKRNEGSYMKHAHETHPKVNKPFLILEKYIKTENRDKITELLAPAEKYLEIIKPYLKNAIKWFKSITRGLSSNYLALILTLIVIVFSLLMPSISQKLHKNSELKVLNNVLHRIQDEVKRAEIECLAANEKICNLHCTLCEEGIETSDCRRENLEPSQITPAGDFTQHNLIPDQRRKGLYSLVDSSLSAGTPLKSKSQFCQSCARTRSILKKNIYN